MIDGRDLYFHRVMSGADRSRSAAALRIATAGAEPFYAGAMRLRNFLYARRILPVRNLGRPTISVGNITTGGTGKTPMVRWLAAQMSASGEKPAILLRGYRAKAGVSDEATLYKESLPDIPVIANPDRIAGAAEALRDHPQTTLFILDDAMQHRRAARDFDLVLIHAGEPFGFNHGFPRGLLREPLAGLGRASAVLLTHTTEVTPEQLLRVESTIFRFNPNVPIFHTNHGIDRLRAVDDQPVDLTSASGKRYFAFCGIGSPRSFFSRLGAVLGVPAGAKAFADHHDYSDTDAAEILRLAQAARAESLITTEKDWVKFRRHAGTSGMLPVLRAELSLHFRAGDDARLLQEIGPALCRARTIPPS